MALAPEVLAQDPDPTVPRGLRRVAWVAAQHLLALVLIPIGLAFWPAYLLARLFLPRPPILPEPARFVHIARLIVTAHAPPPGRDGLDRWRLLLALVTSAALSSLKGLSWMLDELLFRRELAENPVEAPLLEISAWRSGSTQLAHLLEEDPNLAAPCMLQAMAPYLWLWRLVRAVFGPWLAPEVVTRFLAARQSPDFLQRHEFDPFRVDTFCVVFLVHQMVPEALAMGPEAGLGEFSHGRITPSTRRMWEEDFVRLVEGLGRRTLAFKGPGPDGRRRRFFLKGHFLAAAPALAERWPDARFVTVTREPAARLRSTLNYLRSSVPDFFGLGPLPWPWIAAMAEPELAYNVAEQAWFTRDDGVYRCVVPFEEFVRDLPGAMGQSTAPAWTPTARLPRCSSAMSARGGSPTGSTTPWRRWASMSPPSIARWPSTGRGVAGHRRRRTSLAAGERRRTRSARLGRTDSGLQDGQPARLPAVGGAL